jgi:glucose/arabinose dehydrogenase
MRALAIALIFAGCRGEPPAYKPAAVRPAPVGDASVASAELFAVPPAVARQVTLAEIAHGLARPVALVVAPGDARQRMFVVEQRGAIRILEHGVLGKRPFFTIGDLSDGNEQGLLGLAFHPRFADNGKLYVDYTTDDLATHIVEYRVSAQDPDLVDPRTARELIRIEHPYSNHNGGNLLFGPDGKLYAGMGDGGAANDPHGNGQNAQALLGKILRFDVDAAKSPPEIVHLGMRNPWRFWFDAKTGDLYIGDVGQNLWEEVDVVAGSDHARHNFGWNTLEGTHCFDAESGTTKASCDRAGLTLPVAEYPHEQGCSVTGGVTYRGKALPILEGRYFYADYCTGLLRSFTYGDGAIRDHWDWKAAIDPEGVLQQISSFGVDAAGEVYIVELTGSIYELAPVR